MLDPRLNTLAGAPRLLVACDFDGTISPIVPDPASAALDDRCGDALRALIALPRTAVAIVSGRALVWLRKAVGGLALPDGHRPMLYGSHGAEADDQPPVVGGEGELLARIAERLGEFASAWPGCLVEHKPTGSALHYRTAPPSTEDAARAAARRIAAALPGVSVRLGSMVVELTTSGITKADAVARARYRAGATAVVFVGDDITDEDAFAALGEADLGVHVGPGVTAATHRVPGVADVALTLEALADARREHLERSAPVPIEQHGVLSDQRTMALVSPRGRVVWLCLPRLDSPAMFAELLGGPRAGFFAVEPEGADGAGGAGVQEPVGDSMVVRTRWKDLTLTDFLDCSAGRAFQRAGRTDLVRLVEGRGRAKIAFAPRLDFGRGTTQLAIAENGLEVLNGAEHCVLYAPGVAWKIVPDAANHTAEAVVDLDALGGRLELELRYGSASLRPGVTPADSRLAQTHKHWSGWAGALRAQGRWRDAMVRAALAIRALCHGPTGSIAAAATTSLPELAGGSRNWDYRFCWPRDAAMSATALLRLGNTGHAMKLADWLVGVVDRLESPDRLRPIYTLGGSDLGPEGEISSLCGYADSRPVRISNAAAQQVQLDVFGPISEMVAEMVRAGVPVSPDYWRLVRAMVAAVEARWHEPDHGIWEIRGPRRHHLHSKVMCWHCVDRALIVHEAVLGRHSAAWVALRDAIAADVLEKGWNDDVGAYTAAYSARDLDAATLVIGLCGLVPLDSPRWRSTVELIDQQLRDGPIVRRYVGDDGLPGTEGGFLICTTWLAEALATIGRIDEATELLDGVCAMAGPCGLLTEQWDERANLGLGNYPQAYSHLGVINAALRIGPMLK